MSSDEKSPASDRTPKRHASVTERDALTVDELEAAIARLTRAIVSAVDDVVAAELVAERRAMREELRALREREAGVVRIEERRR
jgi:uncharacterized protein YeeX (DUF496 family)